MFTGRETELNYLNNCYQKNNSRIVVVYGQQGVGKTALLKQFCRGRVHFSYEAVACSTRQQMAFLARQMNEQTDGIGASLPEYPSFEEIFAALEDWQGDKRILVIDEFHNLCKTDTAFFDALCDYLNNRPQDNRLFIVLCTSSIGWVENTMVSKMKGLARMVSGFLKIRELKYRELVKAFPGFSPEECIGAYSILGGIPGLWQYFDDSLSLRDNIEQKILRPGEVLFSYGQQVVEQELRETAVYNTILCALAQGRKKLNDLYLHTGFSRAKISVYLKNLMQLELVEKVFSMETEGRSNTQKGVYQIRHPYVRFYYHYIFPHRSALARLRPPEFYDRFMTRDFRQFSAPCFVQVCREYLEKENIQRHLPGKYGHLEQWVGKTGNIDFIFQDEEGNTLAGICNWEKEVMTYQDYEGLKDSLNKAKLRGDYLVLFSAGTFDERLQDEAKMNPGLVLHTIDRLGQ